MKIVLHSDDINLLSHWQKALDKRSYTVEEDMESLAQTSDSIIILNYEAIKRKDQMILKHLQEQNNRVLLLHRVPDITTAKRVLQEGAMGYGNALMNEHFLLSALHTLREDMIWLAPDLTSQLIMQIPQSQENKTDTILTKLTQREKEVALLLKDGLTYKDIATRLGISPRTVKAHARAIYKKLDVHDRIGLALLLK